MIKRRRMSISSWIGAAGCNMSMLRAARIFCSSSEIETRSVFVLPLFSG